MRFAVFIVIAVAFLPTSFDDSVSVVVLCQSRHIKQIRVVGFQFFCSLFAYYRQIGLQIQLLLIARSFPGRAGEGMRTV